MKGVKKLLQEATEDRAKLVFQLQTLDFHIEKLRQAVASSSEKPARRGRKPSATSIHAIAEKALDLKREGLKVRGLVAAMTALGFATKSENPENTVNSILRRYDKKFVKLADGRWILVKHRASADANGVKVSSNGQKETPLHSG